MSTSLSSDPPARSESETNASQPRFEHETTQTEDPKSNNGIMRILTWLPTPPDQRTGIYVYDGKPMPSDLMKAYLDHRPWGEELEDRFRRVDGRTVPREQRLNPPAGMLPDLGSKEGKGGGEEEGEREDWERGAEWKSGLWDCAK